jgi:hypothetical protein
MKIMGKLILSVGLVLALNQGFAQGPVRSGPGVIETMTATDVYQLRSYSDEQLQAFVTVLAATPSIPADALPYGGRSGNFFSLQNPSWPPLPANINGNSVWQGNGVYLLNDLDFNYQTAGRPPLRSRQAMAAGAAVSAAAGVQAEDETGGGLSPGGGGGTGSPQDYTYTPPNYGTNLWIARVHLSSTNLLAIASNTIPDVEYNIQSWTNLADPANWVSQGSILGSETTNWTPLTPLPYSPTNNLFVRLQSQASSDGSGLPDWWELEYFGTTGINPNAQDSAGDGWTIYQKYQMGVAPNVWVTPPPPQNMAAVYNLNTGTETVGWSPSLGATSYTLTEYNEETGQTTTIPLSSANTSYTMYLAPESPDFSNPPQGPQLDVILGLQANYGTNGSSPSVSQFAEGDVAPSANLFNGGDGRLCYRFQGLPADLSAVRIYRQQAGWFTDFDIYNTEDPYDEEDLLYNFPYTPMSDGYFEMPAAGITNGVCQLPDAQVPPYIAFNFWVQTVRSNGVDSAWTASNPSANQYYYVASKAFVDVRRQIKDNLIFLLRAADQNGPFAFWVNEGSEDWSGSSVFTWANNYAYADFYNNFNNVYTVDEFRPLQDNYFYRNFLFDPNNLTSDGFLNTGAFETDPISVTNYPTYYFDTASFITAANPAVPASQLTPALSQWILPGDEDALLLTETNFVVGQQNCYGLPYLSSKIAWVTNDQTYVSTFYPGNPLPVGDSWVIYNDLAQPQFEAAGYYFARPNIDPMPEQDGFSATGPQPLMLAGVGSSFAVAGYSKLSVANGYPGVCGYLGQYFSGAYQINSNGVVTANSAGIISPYGVFSPTVPGPAALVTMPDLDTGIQGTCTVYAVSLQLDANHDGVMDTTFSGPDATSPSSPYVFWCNNNYDRWKTTASVFGLLYTDVEQDDQQIATCPGALSTPTADCNYMNEYDQRVIPCTRDLEDYARLWLCGLTSNLLAALPIGSSVTLSWQNVTAGNPAIDLFVAADPDGGIGYQTNETTATLQTNNELCPYVGRVSPGAGSIQLNSLLNHLPSSHFIWCGVSNGTGGLTLTISDANNNVLAQTTAYIQIQDIKQMYERWTVGDNANAAPASTATLATDNGSPIGASPFQYPSPQNANTPYILHVHGYNMASWEKDRFAETEYKRLYWQGYQGRFGEFRWPTTIQGAANVQTAFNDSEFNSWASAPGLLNLLTNLDAEYNGNVYLTAHSHGNVVAGEALRLAGNRRVVNTYIALQGAVAAKAYDPITPYRYSPIYPDYYSQYSPNGGACYFNYSAGAGTYINFFNSNDWALVQLWEPNEDLKPASGYGFEANFMQTNFYRGTLGNNTPLVLPAFTYSVYSYCDPASCWALGAQSSVNGAFKGSQINLQTIFPPDPSTTDPNKEYSTHVWHSAEFRSDNPSRAEFWNSVLGINGFNLK